MRRTIASWALGVSIVAVAGCATRGSGAGHVEVPGKADAEGEATFTWRADARGARGEIRAVLPDGRVFVGSFAQSAGTTRAEDVAPYAASPAAEPYGGRWDHDDGRPYDAMALARRPSGRVRARLDGPRGEHMRCRFRLARPEDGPRSGGLGECEVSTGETIVDAVLRGEHEAD